MTHDEFLEIQERVQPQLLDKTDAFILLVEVRRLRRLLTRITQLTHLNESIWDRDARLKHAHERLFEIHELCKGERKWDIVKG